MKLYVLEEAPQAPQSLLPEGPPRRPRLSAMGIVGAAGVVVAVVAVLIANDDRGTDAHTQSTSAERVAIAQPPASIGRVAPGVVIPSSSGEPAATGVVEDRREPSSITRKGERVFVDLRRVDARSAIAMMSGATNATVDGADAMRTLDPPLTVKLVAPSPVAAWQSVFGDLANFAVSCSSRGCIVHFVASASRNTSPGAPPLGAVVATRPPVPPEESEPPQQIAVPAAVPQTNATVYPPED